MSSQQQHVSLPSINELLPEFMMQNWYTESRERSTVEPLRNETTRGHEGRATTYHDAMDEDRRWYANREYQNPPGHHPYSRPYLDQRAQSGVSYYDTRPAYAPSHYPPTAPVASGPEPSSPVNYSLDVLRPHPLTANLENVASSTDVAAPPRISHAGLLTSGAPDPAAASAQKVRPSFRVQIPPTPPPGQDAPGSSRSALYHGSIPPAPPARSMDYDMLPSPVPQSYPADPYFSPHIPSSKQQSLYRMQTHASASQNVEEKKHCCPHCKKRFNRPSSLNIHVNTHTGAKPFQCPYPGCNRKFNVNSNMRRHWRNHLSSRGRRDSVTQLPETMPPTPPLTASASSSPRSHYTNSLPSSISSNGSSAAYDSRSPSPQLSVSEAGDGDMRMRLDGRRPDLDPVVPLHTVSTRPIRPMDVSAAPAEARFEGGADREGFRWRQRSRSSPVPRYRESIATGHLVHSASGSRARSNSCNVPGCDCRPISTTLRPAFPSTTAPAAGPSH